MKLVLLSTALLLGLAAPTWAAMPDAGTVVMADGTEEAAAFPSTTITYVRFPSGNWGYQLIVGDCGPRDAILADAKPFYVNGKLSQFIVCGN